MYRALYLLLGLCLVVAGAVAARLRPDLRKDIASAAIFGVIWGPISEYWFLKDYWHPESILGRAWLEDAIYGAGISVVGSIAYKLVFRRTLRRDPTLPARPLLLIAFPASYSLAMLVFQTGLGVNSILVAVGVYTALSLWILSHRHDLLAASIFSAVILAVVSVMGYAVGLDWLVNGRAVLHKVWLLDDKPLGITFLGHVPATEVLWYAGWGLLLGVSYEYVCGLRLLKIHTTAA